ncbi:hypothetical protein V6N13_148812 [Hibiscus sabdariffa]|uniref:diacylglycerol O-acyltransferase n=1 Tax=Hibiscus sabdariffa TaxID=183260 RepID=A0ABR2EJL6_9ROSI
MRWVPTQVDLERHVIVPELDQNMNSPHKFIEDYVQNMSKATIDKSQPLWDLHLLKLRTSQSESIGIFRIHHSLGDGTSLLSLLLACNRKMKDSEALPTIPIRKKKEKKNDHSGFRRFMLRFWFMLQVFLNIVVDVIMFLATTLLLTDTLNPLNGRSGSESTPHRIVHITFN